MVISNDKWIKFGSKHDISLCFSSFQVIFSKTENFFIKTEKFSSKLRNFFKNENLKSQKLLNAEFIGI